MPPPLAPETIDLIIDHLHNDKFSLQACSLTCKQWFTCSRYHLFSQLSLSPYNVHMFRNLLETARYDIASNIRHLTLSEFNGFICWHEGIDLDAAIEDLRCISRHLQHVTFMRVVKSGELDLDILSSLAGVQEMEMVDLNVSSMYDILKQVDAVPNLRTLSLENVSCSWPYGGLTWPFQRPTFAFRTMKLEGMAFMDVANWLLSLTPSPGVHTLYCRVYDHVASQSRGALLKSVGHSVHSFHLYFSNPMLVEDFDTIPFIDISTCTNLCTLHLMDIPTQGAYSRWILDTLSCMTSPKLKKLVLDFSTPHSGSFWVNSLDTAGIAQVLATKFKDLRSLLIDCRFRIRAIHNPDRIVERRIDPEIEKSISEGAFSDLNRRGVLQFIHTDIWNTSRNGII